MATVVDSPFGDLIDQDVNWQLCWNREDRQVYVFTHEMSKQTSRRGPTWTGRWHVVKVGTPEKAKKAYPECRQKIDQICH